MKILLKMTTKHRKSINFLAKIYASIRPLYQRLAFKNEKA